MTFNSFCGKIILLSPAAVIFFSGEMKKKRLFDRFLNRISAHYDRKKNSNKILRLPDPMLRFLSIFSEQNIWQLFNKKASCTIMCGFHSEVYNWAFCVIPPAQYAQIKQRRTWWAEPRQEGGICMDVKTPQRFCPGRSGAEKKVAS